MSNCVALNHFEVIQMADKTGLPKMVVGAVFGVWQKENNNYDRFPNDSEFNAILNRPKEVKTKEVTVVPSKVEQPKFAVGDSKIVQKLKDSGFFNTWNGVLIIKQQFYAQGINFINKLRTEYNNPTIIKIEAAKSVRGGKNQVTYKVIVNETPQTQLSFSKGSETEYIDNKTAQRLLDKLQAKTGIVGAIVSPQKAKEILKDSLYGYNNQNAFYYKGFVYLVEGKIKKDSPFHEVAHPIIAAIQKHSPSVFNNLYKELGSTEEGKAIIAKVNQDYPELNATELQEEAIVTAIGLKAAQNITDGKFSELVDRILKVIKAFMQKVIGIKDFNDNTTLEEIAKYLSDDETVINLKENITNFEGTIIEYVNHIGLHSDGRQIGARNINKGEKIQVVLSEMRKKFEEKSWTNPVNSEPLPADAFKTFDELMKFMFLHEKAHEYILREPGEETGSYETRINNEALRRLRTDYKDNQDIKFQKEGNPFEVPADNSLLVLQYDGFKERNTSEPSKELKEVAEKLMLNRQTLTLDGELKRYIDETGLSYERLTNYIKGFSFNGIKDYFKFEGDETLYEENREWGNQIDDIARGVLEYEDKVNCAIRWNEGINQRKSSSNAIITDRVFEEVYDYITKLRDVQFKDAVLIPQVPFKNDTKRVAGVADIVAVYPNGTIKIVDVKSSELSIYWKDYEKEFELNDTKEKRSSKENKHKAQLSGYKAMATNQGFIFNKEDELYIANLHITGLEENSNVVENVYGENPRPLTSLREIVEALQEQPKEEVIKEEGLTLIEGILKNLENRKKLLGQNKDKTTSAKLFQLEQLQKDIRDGEILVGIHKFINSVYDISEGNGTFPSMVKDIQTKVNKIQSGRITGQDIFTELLQARHQAEFLLQSAKQIKAFYQDNYENIVGEVEVDSDIDKLRIIIDSADILERYYNKTISPLIADELAKHISKSANVEIVKEIEARESKLAKAIIKGESERVIKQYKNDIKGLKLKAGSDIGINKELLLQYLTDGSPEDISFFDAKLSSMINLSNPLISLFALKLKSALEKARITSLQLAQKNFRIFDKFAKATGRNQNDVAEFNRGLYEIVPTYAGKNEDGTDKYVDYAGFVNPTDLKAYNTAKKDFFSKKRTKAEVKAWYDENTQELPEEDEFIINPVNQEKIITLKGKNTLLEEKRELRDQDIISLREYQFWEEMILENKHQYSNTYKKELKIPNKAKYTSKAYENILSNPAMKEMYDNLLATYLKAQEELPEIGRARLGYILPGIPKNVTDLVREEGIKSWLQRSWEEKTSLMAYDTNTKVTGKNADETSKEWEHLKTIPIMFGNPLDATRTSLDLFAVVNIFTEASQMYKAQSMNKDFSEILLDNIKEKGYTQRDVFGNPVIDAAAHKLGLTNELLKYKKEVGNSNMAMMMGAMIEKNIYGKTKVSNPTAILGKTIYVDKWYDAFAAFVGAIQIGGPNWVVPTINYLNGRVQASIEQKAKQFFKEGSWNRAVAVEAKYTINDSIKDFSNPLNKSLVGQLIDLYTPNFGTYTDQMGRTVTQTVAKKLFNTSSWFLLQNKAQHTIDTQVMLAYLMSKQVKQNGKDISLYDAYEVIDGVIQLKSGVELNDLVDTEAQNTIHALNKRMNGVYDSFNAPDIERYWYGRMFMMFRKFFVPGLKRRYKGIGVDEELGQLTEGYYITFYKALITDWKQLFKFYIGQESNLTPMEKQNVQRALREQAVLLSTGVLIMVLSSLGADDKKERQKYQWLLFLSLKLNSEIGTFGGIGDPSSGVIFPNIGEIKRTIWSLPPVIREFESILDFLTAIKNPTDTYQTSTGIHEKGDLKLPAKFWKMLSITGTNWNPETTNKWYMQQNK